MSDQPAIPTADAVETFKVTHTGNYQALWSAAMDWLVSEGILRPTGESTLERLIYQARNQAEETLFEQIASQLTPEDRERLDGLLKIDTEESGLLVCCPAASGLSCGH